ncbi:MAG: response regulator [Pseudomonadota bacterium]|nr:response regulator [Pseudomonadota bacterium]
MSDAGEIPPPFILVVDDDPRLRGLLEKFLTDQGFMVVVARDAADARAKMAVAVFDLVVLDVMMPGEDGLTLTADLRRTSDIPVLLLTARGEVEDRLTGLESGADDYLTKPFEPRELVLRINAILRRTPRPAGTAGEVTIGPWTFQAGRDTLIQGETTVRLSAAEANLLRTLLRKPGVVFSREDLAGKLGLEGQVRTVDVQVTRLRRKMEADPKVPRWLQTVRGEGYVLWQS